MTSLTATCVVENLHDRHRAARIARLAVLETTPFTWLPAATLEGIGVQPEKQSVLFAIPGGGRVRRAVGFVVLRIGRHVTTDQVVFAAAEDQLVLGARSLSGLRLRVDSPRLKLVADAPAPVPANHPVGGRIGGMPQSGKPYSLLGFAAGLKLDGPSDWSERLDDYLYGSR
jgi:hypothetical protein